MNNYAIFCFKITFLIVCESQHFMHKLTNACMASLKTQTYELHMFYLTPIPGNRKFMQTKPFKIHPIQYLKILRKLEKKSIHSFKNEKLCWHWNKHLPKNTEQCENLSKTLNFQSNHSQPRIVSPFLRACVCCA